MKNPWLEIPSVDYENHMHAVGQARELNEQTKHALQRWTPENFALLGCSTGNGLEHVNPGITKTVHAIDINPQYLQKTKENYGLKIPGLQLHHLDVQQDRLLLKNIDLFFIGLVLEYTDPHVVLPKVASALSNKGVLTIIIQKNIQTSFVSNTNYHSLKKLEQISGEVSEDDLDACLKDESMVLIDRKEIALTKHKSFIRLDYK
jgi:hypothetical protein